MAGNGTNNAKGFPLVFVSKPIILPTAIVRGEVYRADLEFIGIDHSGASYEGRVYLNNPNANHATPKDARYGYAGSLFVFAHGGCFGSVGHCEVKERTRRYDLRDSHPLTLLNKRLIVTQQLIAIAKEVQELIVSIVPLVSNDIEKWITKDVDIKNVVNLQKILINAYS